MRQNVCANISLEFLFLLSLFISSLCDKKLNYIDRQINSRQNLLDRIKLVTIKLSESHCLCLGRNIQESQC